MRLAILLTFAFVAGCSDQSATYWQLPKHLNEVSGLTASGEHHVLMHDDEKARVYELDINSGAIEPVFQIEKPVVRDDFEGIAILDSDVYLTTSQGLLFQVENGIGKKGETVNAIKLKTGVAKRCEFEGLTSHKQFLLLLCKTTFKKADKDHLVILAVNPQNGESSEFLKLPFGDIDEKRLNPSGIVSTGDELLIVAAKQRKLLKLSAEGQLIETKKLNKNSHRQAEGIALMPDGRVFIADEGAGKGGRVTAFQF